MKEQTEKLDESFDSDDEDEQEATDCLDFLNGEGDSDDNSDEERALYLLIQNEIQLDIYSQKVTSSLLYK